MTSSLYLRWALTVVFAALGGYCLLRCTLPATHRGCRWSGWLSDAAHVAMSAAMIAMLWALARGDRWGVQMTVFAAAAAWFVVRAADGRQVRRDRIALVHRGVAMAAMFWMLLAASGVLAVPPAGMPDAAMAGMRHTGTSPGVVHAIALGFAGYLGVAALWWARTAFLLARFGAAAAAGVGPGGGPDLPRLVFGPVGEAGCQMLMAAAMCVALLAPM